MKCKLLGVANKKGDKKDGSGTYSIDFAEFLLENYDKPRLVVDKDQADELRSLVGKTGTLYLSWNARAEKFQYDKFVAAA